MSSCLMVDMFHHEMYLQNFIDSKLFADFFSKTKERIDNV